MTTFSPPDETLARDLLPLRLAVAIKSTMSRTHQFSWRWHAVSHVCSSSCGCVSALEFSVMRCTLYDEVLMRAGDMQIRIRNSCRAADRDVAAAAPRWTRSPAGAAAN